MSVVSFTVPGDVRGKGRPRFGRGGTYTDAKTASYENLVALVARQAMGARPLIDAPVCITVAARFAVPASASRKAKLAMLDGLTPPAKKPDLDNICKVVDALNGIVWKDDAQIVSLSACKFYAETPGLDIVIRPYVAPAAQAVSA